VQGSTLTQESFLNQPQSPGGFSSTDGPGRSGYPSGPEAGGAGGGAIDSESRYQRSHFAPVLAVDGLTQYDCVAFACRFLEDESLISYLDEMEASALATGSLKGVLLVGLTEKSIPLLQAYVDITADVQTAALLLAFVSPRRFKCAEAGHWMTTYRELLDRWQLYHQRCLLDICIVPYSGNKVPPQTYAACQFW